MLYWSRSWSRRIPPAALFAALIAILAATLAACGTSSTASGPVNLTFWGFNQQIADQAKLFNDTHPNIHVTGIKQDSGPNQYYPKVLTAVKAGNGPDVALVEYQYIPTLSSILHMVKFKLVLSFPDLLCHTNTNLLYPSR